MRTNSSYPFYHVAIGLGISFMVALMVLAWHNALNSAQNKFSLQSVTLKDNINASINAADDTINDIITLLNSLENISQDSFREYATAYLNRHPFIERISYFESKAVSTTTSQRLNFSDYQMVYDIHRNQTKYSEWDDKIIIQTRLNDVLNVLSESNGVIPTPLFIDQQQHKSFFLTGTVHRKHQNLQNKQMAKGFLTVQVNPLNLLNHNNLSPNIHISLVSETEGLIGRQTLLASQTDNNQSSWALNRLTEEKAMQFPLYSMRLVIDKSLHWADVQLWLIFTAFVLGLGMTLLIVALARAKEIQAQVLQDRNTEIERQVRRQTKELAFARDKALEASRIKSEFLASMSHEIRTPLNAIIGMAELLNETELNHDQYKYVNIFKKAGEALLSLVNDILDLSKIEAGQLILENIDFNLRELVEETIDIYALKADEKGIELVCQVAPDVPRYVTGDSARLRQIILNLVGNAIKFTEKGEVILKVTRNSNSGSAGAVIFTVSDTGIGIPKDKIESIFSSFTQVDSSTTRKYGGTGLGLTISRRLVELMNGRISVKSEIGKGSQFAFNLEFGLAAAPEYKTLTNIMDLRDKRILIIDDNETNRLIQRETLQSIGCEVSEACSGPAAINLIENQPQSSRPFDLILTDCQMPGMDGFEVVEKIRKLGRNAETILMLTSSSLSHDLIKARTLGLGAYLVKPVKSAELIRAIHTVLKPRGAPQNNSNNLLPEMIRDVKIPILLVEDNLDNRLLIRAYLKDTIYVLDEAENGAIGLERFQSKDYRLVLMDVQMPILDGHEATRAIRNWELEHNRKATPIIALTAHAIKEDTEMSLAAGCNAHLTKPIKKNTLVQTLDQFILETESQLTT